MEVRALAIHLDSPPEIGRLTKLAAGLAAQLESMLIGLATTAPKPLSKGASLTFQPAAAQDRDLAITMKRMEASFRGLAEGIKVEWRAAISPNPTDFVLEQAAIADLIMVEHKTGSDSVGRLDIGRLVMEAGRPVLLLPPQIDSLSMDRVLIAYKPVKAGRMAVQAALPLLRLARRILIVGIGPEASSAQVDDVQRYLSRHEIDAAVRHEADPLETTSDTLLNLAKDDGSQLLVGGAYSRGRARQMLFGGVTRDLFSRAHLPWLLTH